MSEFTLYHNPNCSKSRATLALLEENDVSPEIIYYLDNPPSAAELKSLLGKLGLGIRDILRQGEGEFEEYDLDDESLNEELVFDIVHRHPILIERPIVTRDTRAIIGRPPENVLQLLDK